MDQAIVKSCSWGDPVRGRQRQLKREARERGETPGLDTGPLWPSNVEKWEREAFGETEGAWDGVERGGRRIRHGQIGMKRGGKTTS